MVRGSICFQTLRAKIPNHALTRAPRSNAGSRPRGRPRSNPTLSRPRMALRAAVQHRVHRFFHRGGELCALVVVQRDGFGAKRRRERLESVRRDAKQRHLGGRRPGTHRPRDGRRLRGYPRGRSRPHPRRGRVPVPAERGGERRGGSRPAPVPVAVPATVPGVGPPCALLPGPAASTAPYAFASASRTFARCSNPQGRSPGRVWSRILALFLDDAHPVRLHLLRGLVRLGSVGVGAGEGALAGERARGGGSWGFGERVRGGEGRGGNLTTRAAAVVPREAGCRFHGRSEAGAPPRRTSFMSCSVRLFRRFSHPTGSLPDMLLGRQG